MKTSKKQRMKNTDDYWFEPQRIEFGSSIDIQVATIEDSCMDSPVTDDIDFSNSGSSGSNSGESSESSSVSHSIERQDNEKVKTTSKPKVKDEDNSELRNLNNLFDTDAETIKNMYAA
jgi:hypothetical protein